MGIHGVYIFFIAIVLLFLIKFSYIRVPHTVFRYFQLPAYFTHTVVDEFFDNGCIDRWEVGTIKVVPPVQVEPA